MGGVIALKVAPILKDRGLEVHNVVMIDSFCPQFARKNLEDTDELTRALLLAAELGALVGGEPLAHPETLMEQPESSRCDYVLEQAHARGTGFTRQVLDRFRAVLRLISMRSDLVNPRFIRVGFTC